MVPETSAAPHRGQYELPEGTSWAQAGQTGTARGSHRPAIPGKIRASQGEGARLSQPLIQGLARPVWPRACAQALLAIAASFAVPNAFAATDEAVFSGPLDTSKPAAEGWSLEGVHIDLGDASLDVKQGTLVPVTGPGARPVEFVVLGDMTFHVATSDPVESYQLDLFTGASALDERVDQAVLMVGSPQLATTLTSRPNRAPLTPAVAKEASAAFTAWRAAPDWHHARAEAAYREIALGDEVAEKRFAAWCRSPRFGSFLYTFDPFRPEQAAVEHYVDPRLGDQEALDATRALRHAREEGRYLALQLEDLGTWDTWFSSPLRGSGGAVRPGREAFEPTRYEMHVEIDDDLSHVATRAKIALRAAIGGERVVHFELDSDLVVRSVKSESGASLPFSREKSKLSVLLPAPAPAGATLSLEIAFDGILFEKDQDGFRYKRDTQGWYPQVALTDRATYRVDFDAPSSIQVLAAGTKAGESSAGGRTTLTKTLDRPTSVYGFEIGHYAVETRQVGHILVEFGYWKDAPSSLAAERGSLVAIATAALSAYEEDFGPYPLDTLTIVTAWHDFSQSLLGFVTIDQETAHLAGGSSLEGMQANGIIAHEISHQWWGHMVGWASDRDQWLSESLATYSSARLRHRKTDSAANVATFPRDRDLNGSTKVDRPNETIGPVTLGPRLNSSIADAYIPVAYGKGSMVFALLEGDIGKEPLAAMLKEIAQRAHGAAIDTRTFLAALEKMSGKDLSAFSRQFVYGVGYPEIHYTYAFAPGASGAWVVNGTVEQIPRGYRRDRLVAVDGGGADIAPTFVAYQKAEDARVFLSARATAKAPGEDVDGATGDAPSKEDAASKVHAYRAQINVVGVKSKFGMTVPEEPAQFAFEPELNFPAPVIDDSYSPKEAMKRRAIALRSAGMKDEAKDAARAALGLTIQDKPDAKHKTSAGDLKYQGQLADGELHIMLAEMALDEGKPDEARAEMGMKEAKMLAGADGYADYRMRVLQARLALRAGDAKGCYGILSGLLRLDIRQSEHDTVKDAAREKKFQAGTWGDGGAYLLLAASADRTGHDVVAREATAEAQRSGAVVGTTAPQPPSQNP